MIVIALDMFSYYSSKITQNNLYQKGNKNTVEGQGQQRAVFKTTLLTAAVKKIYTFSLL